MYFVVRRCRRSIFFDDGWLRIRLARRGNHVQCRWSKRDGPYVFNGKMRRVNLTKLTSRECRQHAFDFEIVVGARLSLLERFAYTVKAIDNRDNLMGLYLSGKEEADEGGGGGGRRETEEAREAENSQREVQRANLPDEIKPARKRNWNRDENYGSHVPRRVLFSSFPRLTHTSGFISEAT